MVQSSSFRPMAKRVLKRVLSRVGFFEQKNVYIRHFGNQVHALNVQTHRHEMTINLYFHYDYVPSFRSGISIEERKRKTLQEFEDLDFLFQSRLGMFMDGRDEWWSFDCNQSECQDLIESKLLRCLDVFEEYRIKWEDPTFFLRVATPEKINQNIIENVKYHDPLAFCYSPWFVMADFFEFLQFIAERSGNAGLSRSYLALQVLRNKRDKAE